MTAILKRLIQLVPTLIGVSILTFVLMRLTPGDPVRLMLGPEATPESITAKRVELGFQRYLPSEPWDARVHRPGERQLLVEILTDDPGFASGRMVHVHFEEEMHPIRGRVTDEHPLDVTVEITGRLISLDGVRQDLVDAQPVTVYLDRELVDRPVVMQYLSWIGGVLQGDMGRSITTNRPVTEEIFTRLPNTFLLAVVAMMFATLTGLIVGTISAVYPHSWLDNIIRLFVFVFLAMPSFWLGLELIILFSRKLQWFPPAGMGHIGHLILPAATLGVGTGAFLSRILRSSMLQVLGMDYVRTARAKGVRETVVIIKHALKNALIPFVTVAGLSLGALLGGSVIVETIFNWPGVGKLMIDSIKERNFPITMGCVLVLATVFVVVNLIVDLLYVVLDPRIRLEGGESN